MLKKLDKWLVISVVILLGYAKYLKEENIEPERMIYHHITVYEEVGHGGAASVPAGVTEAISVDMGCVGDGLQCTEKQVSIAAKDSAGPYHYDVVTKLVPAKKDLTITGATTQLYYLGRDKNLSFEGLDTFSLKDNQAVTDESGLIRGNKNGNGTISISGNNSVLIDNNDTVSTGSNMYGGVLRSYLVDLKIDNNTKIDITGNNYSSTFSDGTKTQSNTYGGAVYFTGGAAVSGRRDPTVLLFPSQPQSAAIGQAIIRH